MLRFCFWLLAVMAAASFASHAQSQSTNAPLSLFISGEGSVSPLTNGELLVVGQSYNMVATPHSAYQFNGWQPVNVFTTTNYVIDTNGITTPIISTIDSPLPIYTNRQSLTFIMQPVVVIYDNPGFRTITESKGWQATFEPISLNVQLIGTNVIVSWPTNLTGFALQAATNLVSPVWTTNLAAPVVVNGQNTLTNRFPARQRVFRLSR